MKVPRHLSLGIIRLEAGSYLSMPSNLRAAACQSIVASFCFALGAILTAVSRGIENGHGGVGINLSPPTIVQANFTVTDEDAAVDGSLKAGETFSRSSATPSVPYVVTEADAAVDSSLKVGATMYRNIDPTSAFFDRYMADANSHLRWQHRREAQAPMVFGLFASLLGWVFALPAVHSLTLVIRSPSASSVLYPFLAAAVLAAVEFTSEAGTAMTSDWMSKWELLRQTRAPGEGDAGELSPVQSFEISYLLAHSRTLWLFAMDGLLLAYALGAASILACSDPQRTLSRSHAALGLMTSLACVADFGFEVTRFLNWRTSVNASIVCTLLIYALLLPSWLLLLGCTLADVEASGGGLYTSTIDDQARDQARERADLESACMASLSEPAAGTHEELNAQPSPEANTSKADGKRKMAPARAVIADASLQDGIDLAEM